jgi:hypothetical protein
MRWRLVLLAGIVLAVAMGCVGLALDRSEVSVGSPEGVPYVRQWPTPFEREIWLRPDHRAVLEEGDKWLWYFGALAVAALTLASIPAVREWERRSR